MGFQPSTRGLAPLIAALLSGCAMLLQPTGAPVPLGASEALVRVRALEWQGGDPTGEERRGLLARAGRLAPTWVAPARLLDELDRIELRGPEVLARRLAALETAEDPAARARASYLLGRLGGKRSRDLMKDSVREDGGFAWGHHGLAWSASKRGDMAEAVVHEQRAISRARDAFDRALFTLSLAHHLRSEEREEEAYAELVALSGERALAESDSVWWAAERAAFGLRSEEREMVDESWRDLLVVLADPLLGEDEAVRLTQLARAARREHPGLDVGGLRLDAALAARPEDSVLFQRARLAHECGRLVRAAALWDRVAEGERRPPTRARRVAGFAAGRFREAVERWVLGLPDFSTDDKGLPRSDTLVAVVLAARRAAPGRADSLRELGDACLEAGWFAEAEAITPHLAALDTEGALSLSERADRGFALLDFFDRSLGKELQPIPEAGAEQHADWLGIERFLSALEDEIDGAHALFGEEEAASLRDSLHESPLYEFSPFAALVHPGPVMSRQDQRLGVGHAGHMVGGLAELGDAMGRFILLGQLAGRDRADGAVFPVLFTDRENGERLGVKWSGSVFWCEGIEPVGWLGRNTGMTGAALHDGYWINVEAVRREHERWLAFRREWSLEDARAVLAIPAPRAETGAERRELLPLLGAGARVRLAVIVDRGGEVPTFTEILSAVEIHEQGHLVDRALHLPLSSHPLRTVRLLGRAGFDPPAVLERLEYRAQVVALCEAEDPRTVLADSLLMVENAPQTARAHARGYEALLRDLLGILDKRVQRDPSAFSGIDPDGALVHELHRLGPEEVRSLGRALAKRVGIP